MKNYHIFISHSWKYDQHYRQIVNWIDSAYSYWSSYSVPCDDPLDVKSTNELKTKLINRISCSSCVIILAGMYATHSEWIDFEINTAVAFDKPIIGVKPWGQERIPNKIEKNACVMVGWNSEPIIRAIREYAL